MAFHFILINSFFFSRFLSRHQPPFIPPSFSTCFGRSLVVAQASHLKYMSSQAVRSRRVSLVNIYFHSLWYLVSEQYYLRRSLVKYKMSQLHMMAYKSRWNWKTKIDHEHFFFCFFVSVCVKRNIFVFCMFNKKSIASTSTWMKTFWPTYTKTNKISKCVLVVFLERWSENVGSKVDGVGAR